MRNGSNQDNRLLCALLAAALCLLAFCCYQNSLSAPFIFDDHGNILDNPAIEFFWPDADEARLASRRPIGHLSLALNYALARWRTGDGLNVRTFHAVNLTIHILAGLLLFDLVRRTLRLESLRQRYGQVAPYLAFAVAALWLVHPLQTSSVTYVIQRLEALMSMFYLLCLYGLLRGSQASDRQSATWWYLVAVAAFWLGLGTKEVIATAVVVAPLYDRTFLSDSWRTVVRRRWAVYMGFLPALVWFTVAVAPAFSPDSGLTTGFGVQSVTPLEYLCSQAGVLLHYLRLVFWPHPLCLDYAWPVARTTSQIVLPGLVIAVLLAASLVALFRWPRIGFLGTAFFLILSPTSSFVPIKELAFEYRMYLPLAPAIILIVFGAYHGVAYLLARWFQAGHAGKGRAKQLEARRQTLQRLAPTALLVTVIAVFAFLTIQRNQDYRSERLIWEDTVRKCPHNARAHINLGNVYLGEAQIHQRSGDAQRANRAHQAALQSYSNAIKVKPDEATAYNNRGRVHVDLQRYDTALRDFDKAIEVDPEYTKAYHNRGNVYMTLGRYDRAIADHSQAVQFDSEAADSYFSRGNSHLKLGELAQAIQDYTTAIKLRPVFPDAYVNRGSARLKLRQTDEAITDLTTAIKQQPTLGAAYSNRALAYCFKGHYQLATEDVERIRRLGQRVDPRLLKLLSSPSGTP